MHPYGLERCPLAGNQFDWCTSEPSAHQCEHRAVGLAVLGRLRHPYFQAIAEHAGEAGTAGTGNDLQSQVETIAGWSGIGG